MTYDQHLTQVAAAVRVLAARSGTVGAGDLNLALTAHASAVTLLQQVQGDLAGQIGRDLRIVTPAIARRTPVGALYQLLRRQPRTTPISVTDAVRQTPNGTDARAWRDLARHSTLAVHHWTHADLARRPYGTEAWPYLEDVAAITEHLPALTRRLAGALRAQNRPALADRYSHADSATLLATAAAVRALARHRPDPATAREPIVAMPRRAVLVMRRPEHIPAGLRRLAQLVQASRALTPQQTQLAARVLVTAVTAARDSYHRTGAAGTAATLNRQRELLTRVVNTGRRAASLTLGGDGLVLGQTQQLHHALKGIPTLTPELAADVAAATSDATRALERTTARQFANGSWLVPHDDPDDKLAWIPLPDGARPPAIATTLRAAAEHEPAVLQALGRLGPTPSAPEHEAARVSRATKAPRATPKAGRRR